MKKDTKIALYGDSISKGVIFDKNRKRYSMIKDSFANIVKDKLCIKASNAGKFGATIINGAKKMYKDLTKTSLDAVIVEYGGNDCDFNWREIALNPNDIHEPKTTISDFTNMLNDIVAKLKEKKITPILMTLPPLDPKRYYKRVCELASDKNNNIIKWLKDINKIYWWQERYSIAIMKIAYQTDSRLIDLRSAFLNTKDYREYLCEDGIHPNENGHRLIAKAILEFIDENYKHILKK